MSSCDAAMGKGKGKGAGRPKGVTDKTRRSDGRWDGKAVTSCHELREKAKEAAEAAGWTCQDADADLNDDADLGDDDDDDTNANAAVGGQLHQYIFTGWNAMARKLLPFGLGNHFPAFLTYCRAVDLVRHFPSPCVLHTRTSQPHRVRRRARRVRRRAHRVRRRARRVRRRAVSEL